MKILKDVAVWICCLLETSTGFLEGHGLNELPSGLLDFFRQHVLQTGAQASTSKYYAYQTATVIPSYHQG